MKRIIQLLASAVLALASAILPMFTNSAFAVPGQPINATVTFSAGALAYMDDSQMNFDDHNITSGTQFNYLSTGGNHTISFNLAFDQGELLNNYVSSITLNGGAVEFESLGEDRYSFTVPELEIYNIDFTVTNAGERSYTIIWANPGATGIDAEDTIFSHGSAKIIAVYRNGALVDQSEYTQTGTVGGVDAGNNGWAKVHAGDRVVFEFVPEYSYQLTSVKANGFPLEPQDVVNQYTFIMPETNIHFAATFTKANNVVTVASDKVVGGSVVLGNNAIANGTARISVDDAELSANKIAEFTTAASGYTISDYLDIDFFNIFYKGKTDTSDVWSNQLHELGSEAAITLTLADDVDVANVVIVHNIGDGDDYEIIEIDSYDTAAHTVTFRTRSFSSFAIATKDATTAGAPDSGYVTKDLASATTSVAATLSSIIASVAFAALALRLCKARRQS